MQATFYLILVFIFLFQFPVVAFIIGNFALVLTLTCTFVIHVVVYPMFYCSLLLSPATPGPSNTDNPATH